MIDLRTIRPLDTETIVKSVQKTHRLVSVEEGWPFAGIGSELSALMMERAFDDLDALAGTSKFADAKAFESATASFAEVDAALWK